MTMDPNRELAVSGDRLTRLGSRIAAGLFVGAALLAIGVWTLRNLQQKPAPARSQLKAGIVLTNNELAVDPARAAKTDELFKPAIPAVASEPRLPANPNGLEPRMPIDTSGFGMLSTGAIGWGPNASLAQIRENWKGWPNRAIEEIDFLLKRADKTVKQRVGLTMRKGACLMAEGKTEEAIAVLASVRDELDADRGEARDMILSTLIYFQGIASLRLGENENCIMCRGESSCILPISAAAVHQNDRGSRQAIQFFTEYLNEFPDDLGVRWLLNLAHMTLGEYPDKVDPKYLISLDRFNHPERSIGKFRDIGEKTGLNRFNQAGGVIMEDFDNDGLLDLAVSCFDPLQALDLYRNVGDGTFARCSEKSPGIEDQLGGLVCVQADYNNDGLMDIFVARGAWLSQPVRPSLLRNDGGFKFTDVTDEAGLKAPVNSNAAAWADYDNDGLADLFICCERQSHRLYRNLGDGTFQDVTLKAGLTGDTEIFGKGCTWIDYDNDDFPDLFLNHLGGVGQLFHNERNGRFTNVSVQMGIDGPDRGFPCWAFDFDNDGWLDIFATCYDQSLGDVVKGLIGEPHNCRSNKLFRNVGGSRFQDVTAEMGLDHVFATMGSNFGDFDNDGFLDFYLGTGAPDFGLLIPNRMFTNVDGKRFVEITGSAGVGNLQKGHGVACGDWDRDGNVDIFIEMGGAVDGDKYHNILFQNPGHDNAWITVKLVGTKTNRAALGARIKITTAGDAPQTIHRHVSPGGSFGSSPLEQTIGLGKAKRVAKLEVHWPTSGTTQEFGDVSVGQSIEITEGDANYRVLDQKPIKH